jgi:hypothetical protein
VIRPPFVPRRGTSLAPPPRSAGEVDHRARGGAASRHRFEYDFETLFAIRVLQAQALWYARLDLAWIAIGFLCAAGMLAAFAGGETRLGLGCAAVLTLAAALQFRFKPRIHWATCNALRNEFVRLRARALEYDDERFGRELRALQEGPVPRVWNGLRLPICNELCAELGCWSDIRTPRPWSAQLLEKLP